MNHLEIKCKDCKVSSSCPEKGSSPLNHGKNQILCRLVGGYGRTPVDESILSEESKQIVNQNGPCLTIVEVPKIDESGRTVFKVVKIFSQPVLHEREQIDWRMNMIMDKSYKE